MLTYKVGESIGRDEEDFNKIFLGRPTRYRTFDLDYTTNLKPRIILESMKFFASKVDEIPFFTREIALGTVSEHLAPILSKCISPEFNTPQQIKLFESAWDSPQGTREVLKKYSTKGGLAGWLANQELNKRNNPELGELAALLESIEPLDNELFDNETKEAREKRQNFLRLFAFLAVIDEEAEFEDYIPKSMYEPAKEFLNMMMGILANGYHTNFPEDLLANVKYKGAKHPNSESEASKINSMEGNRFVRNMLIINNYEFKTAKDNRLFREIMSYSDKSILTGICFQDCCFNMDNAIFTEVFGKMIFQSCRFDKPIHINSVLEGDIEFEDCIFTNGLDLSRLQFNSIASVDIKRSFFENGATCDLSEIHSYNSTSPYIFISNTVFNGELKLNDVRDTFFIKMDNVSFGCPFQIQGFKMDTASKFENLCFSSIPSSQMDKSRRDLYEVMKNTGLEQRAKDLGILPSEKETTNVKFDYDAYQIAYNSGFLKPEYAAYFLGKSKVYLQKKRTQDKQKITRDSLPFKIDGRDVQYPVEALLAFKAKDWDTLKNLRKKYPIPTD